MVSSLDGTPIATVTMALLPRDWVEVMPVALFELSEMLMERFHHAGLDRLFMQCQDGWALTLRAGQGALLTVVGKSDFPFCDALPEIEQFAERLDLHLTSTRAGGNSPA